MVTYFLFDVLGKLTGIYCVAIFINFLLRKKTKSENTKQKYVATLLSTILYIVIPALVYKKLNYDIYDIVGDIVLSFICGIVVGGFFMRKFQLKTYLQILLTSLIFWFVGTSMFLLLKPLGIYRGYIRAPLLLIAITFTSILVLKQKHKQSEK